MEHIDRRTFIGACCCVGTVLRTASLQASGEGSDPWLASELIGSRELLEEVKRADKPLHILCVGFPSLYRQRHIVQAKLAGPCSKPDGIAALSSAVAGVRKSAVIVLYCGCCPMKDCPNIRPAYRKLKELGFRDIRVLDLPTNFHTDWVAKGYPTEK